MVQEADIVNQYIKVVIKHEDGSIYKARVPVSTYQTTTNGNTSFTLPENVKSKGWYERVCGGKWASLAEKP